MGKIFVGQTALTIIVDCGTDVSAATSSLIKYRKPDGREGVLTASLKSGTTTKIEHEVTDPTLLNQAGQYLFWAHITWSTTDIAPGEASKLMVYEEGS